MFGAKRVVWRRKAVFGGEKGCRGYNGVFRAQMGCFEAFGGERGVRGCRRHNGVYGAQMRCWPWGERDVWWVKMGVWGEKGCLVAKSGVWGRKGVFGIYIFFNKSSLGDKAGPACPV